MSERRELILYATPTGALAAQCEAYFASVSRDLAPTTAQTYPPHATLTGFFHRETQRVAGVVGLVRSRVASVGPIPSDAIRVDGLLTMTGWVGLTLSSDWLIDLTAAVVASDRLEDGDDEMRPNDWLHLSLAYNTDPRPLGPYADRAIEMVDPTAEVAWEVALWERDGVTWTRLT